MPGKRKKRIEYFSDLFYRYYGLMYRVAKNACSDHQKAEDAVSEAALLLLEKTPRLMELSEEAVKGYVVATVKNAVYLQHRKERGGTESLEQITEEIPDTEGEPGALLQQKELKNTIRWQTTRHGNADADHPGASGG